MSRSSDTTTILPGHVVSKLLQVDDPDNLAQWRIEARNFLYSVVGVGTKVIDQEDFQMATKSVFNLKPPKRNNFNSKSEYDQATRSHLGDLDKLQKQDDRFDRELAKHRSITSALFSACSPSFSDLLFTTNSIAKQAYDTGNPMILWREINAFAEKIHHGTPVTRFVNTVNNLARMWTEADNKSLSLTVDHRLRALMLELVGHVDLWRKQPVELDRTLAYCIMLTFHETRFGNFKDGMVKLAKSETTLY